MCDWNIDTAVTSERMSAWALAMRDRAVTLAYSGTAIETRTPIIATTIISSIRVKPRAFHRIDLMASPATSPRCSDGANPSAVAVSPEKSLSGADDRRHDALETAIICQRGDGKRQLDEKWRNCRPRPTDPIGPAAQELESIQARWDPSSSRRSATHTAYGACESSSSNQAPVDCSGTLRILTWCQGVTRRIRVFRLRRSRY